MKRFATVLGAAVFALTVLAPAANSTQVLYRTPQQLGQDAELVVDGTVTSVRSYWNDTRTRILTEAVVEVVGAHKGSAPATVRVVQMGGTIGTIKMTVHGALSWRSGEEVLLFLEPALPGTYQVAGFSQGKYEVERDPRSGKAFVRGVSGQGVELVGAPDDATAATTRRVALDDFISEIFGNR